jgi:hypothetical protein
VSDTDSAIETVVILTHIRSKLARRLLPGVPPTVSRAGNTAAAPSNSLRPPCRFWQRHSERRQSPLVTTGAFCNEPFGR